MPPLERPARPDPASRARSANHSPDRPGRPDVAGTAGTSGTSGPPRPAARAETTLLHTGRPGGALTGPVNPPLYRCSTITFDSVAEYERAAAGRFDQLLYGRAGSPTLWALEDALCELEGAADCVLLPAGLAAIQTALLAVLAAGDHLLVPHAVYPPVRQLCGNTLRRFGVEVEYYDPTLGAGIEALLRPNTRAVYVESPGTFTFEVQDLPAIAAAAHAAGAVVIADNTWAAGLLCRALDLGADLVVHSGTKYLAGHADTLIGAVLANAAQAERLREYWFEAGSCAGADEAWLTLRGLRTLPVRLRQHQASALAVARWLEQQPQVARVHYPALPGHPQHALWRRDFQGASGLLAFVPAAASDAQVDACANALRWFRIGVSWGGYESLVLPGRPAHGAPDGPKLLRLHVGLEHVDDLIADLAQALPALGQAQRPAPPLAGPDG